MGTLHQPHASRRSVFAVMLLLLLMVSAASLFLGRAPVTPWGLIESLRAGNAVKDDPLLGIFLYQRLPRTLAAMLAGAGLALAGCVFQALLRNPLATPYTLGVANAAALGAWVAVLLGDAGLWTNAGFGPYASQAMAFLFALLDVALVYMLATRRGGAAPTVLLLAGVTLGMLFNAGLLLSRFLAAPDRLAAMDRWLMGGVDVLGFRPVLFLVVGALPVMLLLLRLAPHFDQYAFDPELAEARGVRVKRLQLWSFLGASFLTAVIVAEVGPIGFVGLIIPHAVRIVTGPRHFLLMPASMLCGAAFLCLCDIAARLVLPGETPIGIITTCIGAPIFLYMLIRRPTMDWNVKS